MPKLLRLKELMPDYYDGVLEMNRLLQVEQFQIDEFNDMVERQAANQYVMTADRDGIAVWEQLVGIEVRPSFDLETRRYDVLARLLPPKPLTIRYLRSVLEGLNIRAKLSVDQSKLHVTVSMSTTDQNAAGRLQKLLNGMLPANMTFTALNNDVNTNVGEEYVGIGSHNSVKQTNKGGE